MFVFIKDYIDAYLSEMHRAEERGGGEEIHYFS